MRFAYSTLKQYTSRATKPALLALIISLFAFGALLANGHANPQADKFTMADATTTEDNGKRVRAKPGFVLVAKNKTTVEARRATKNTMSEDNRTCDCSPPPSGSWSCGFSLGDDGVARCGGSAQSSACCRWVKVN